MAFFVRNEDGFLLLRGISSGRFWVCAAMALSAVQGTAFAQMVAEDSLRSQSSPLGGRLVTSGDKALAIEPTISVSYDDNVYRQGSGQPHVDDWFVSPGLDLRFKRSIGVHDLNLRASGRYDFYMNETARNNGRFSLAGDLGLKVMGRCLITPQASYRQQKSDYGDQGEAIANTQKYGVLSLSAACPVSAGIYPLANYTHSTTRNDYAFDYADQTGDRFMGGIALAKPSFGLLTGYYAHERVDRPVLDIVNTSDQFGLKFTRAISSKIQAKIDVSYLNVDSSSSGIRGYNGAGWDVELSSRIIPRTLISANFSRKITNDNLVASGYAIQTGYSGQARVALSELSAVRLFADYRTRRFRQDALITQTELQSDNFLYFGAALSRRLSSYLDTELGAARYRRRVSAESGGYEATQVALSVRGHF